ncbi:MAG: LCP family protein [Clostridium sp.]|nr:LCP family protein [Clostridium sp.]
MPRFENEGFNPNAKNRDVDRTVPENENFYGYSPIDLNFNNRENVVRDNQVKRGFNPCDAYPNNNLEPPAPSNRQEQFRSETIDDFLPPPPRRTQTQRDMGSDNPRRNGTRKPEPKRRKPKGKRLTKKKIGIIIAAVILAIILIIVGIMSSVLNRINYKDKVENTYVSADALESSTAVKNILLLGVDARSGESGEETRSDTMMLVSLDSKHHCIKLTSFLRDTWVYIPTLGYEQRLNAACSSGGYQGVVDAIEYNFGVAIDGYAVVDFEMFKVLVDSLGGVEVDVTEAEAKEVTNHPKRYGNVELTSGKYKLSGEQALAYCRIRKIDTDFVRTERQRTVMSAILGSAKSANPFKLVNMVYSSAPYIETDLTKSEIKKLAVKAVSCLRGDINQTKVPFEGTWDYATISGNSVISINVEKNKTKLIDYIYNLSPADIKAQEKED